MKTITSALLKRFSKTLSPVALALLLFGFWSAPALAADCPGGVSEESIPSVSHTINCSVLGGAISSSVTVTKNGGFYQLTDLSNATAADAMGTPVALNDVLTDGTCYTFTSTGAGTSGAEYQGTMINAVGFTNVGAGACSGGGGGGGFTPPEAPAVTSDTTAVSSDYVVSGTHPVDGTIITVVIDANLNNLIDIEEPPATGPVVVSAGSWTTAPISISGDTRFLVVANDPISGLPSSVVVHNVSYSVADTTPPSLSGVAFEPSVVNAANQTAVSFSLQGAETGTTASYRITSSAGETDVEGGPVSVDEANQTIAGVNVSSLSDGTLTLSLTLTDAADNSSDAVTDTIQKDATAPAVTAIAVTNGFYNAGDSISLSLTLNEAVTVTGSSSTLSIVLGEVIKQASFVNASGSSITYRYTVQAGDNTSGSGVVVSASGLSLNGTTIKDSAGNDANLAFTQFSNSNAIADTVAPSGYSASITPATIDKSNEAAVAIQLSNAEVGATYTYSISSSGGGTAVTGSGTVSTASALIGGINVTALPEGTLTLAVTLTDSAGNSGEAKTATATKRYAAAPVITEGESKAVTMSEDGAPKAFSLMLNATDANNDSLSWSIKTAAGHGEAGVSGTGNSKIVNYSPDSDFNGTDSFEVQVSDGTLTDSIVVNVTVDAVNDAPVLEQFTGWQSVGAPGLSAGEAGYPSLALASDGTPYLAYRDSTGNRGKATVITFNATENTWLSVGSSGISAGYANYTSLALASDGTPYLAYMDGGHGLKATVMTFDASKKGWSSVDAPGLSAGLANFTSLALAADGTPYLAYQDYANGNKATVMKFNATKKEWVSVGAPGLSAGGVHYTSLALASDGTPYLAYLDGANRDKATVMKFNAAGDTWSSVGAPGISAGSANYTSLALASDGTPYLAYQDGANGSKATVMTFDATKKEWVSVGDTGLSAGRADYISLALASDGTPYLAYQDFGNGYKATVMTYRQSALGGSLALTEDSSGKRLLDGVTIADTDSDKVTLTLTLLNRAAGTLSGKASGAATLDYDPETGKLTLTGSPADVNASLASIVFTPAANYSGRFSFTLELSDGDTSINKVTTSVVVTDVNDAPTITGTPDTSVKEGSEYKFTPEAKDVDAGTTFTFSIENKPEWAIFNTATGALTGTPGNEHVGTTQGIVIRVSDSIASAELYAFDLTVVNVNDAPTITGSPAITVNEGSPYSFTPTASDVDAGTTLTFSITNKPAWASFNTATGALTGTPGNEHVGTTQGVVIRVSDGVASAELPAFDLTVVNVNAAPVITSTASTSASQGEAYSYTLTATDEDVGDSLSFSAPTKPAWLNFNAASGVLSGTPTRADVGSHAVILVVTDSGGLTATQSFSIEVVSTNEAPVATDRAATLDEDTPLSLTLTAQDPDQDELTFEIVTEPEHGTVTLQGALLVYTPELNFNGTDSIGFIASDAEFSSDAATLSLTVNAVNDNPVLVDDSFSLQRTTTNQYLLNVLANDSDVDGDTLTIDGASSTVGTVIFNAQGLTLTTPDRYVGPVSLRYTVTDGKGGRDTADVNLIIEGGVAADLPVITVPADIEVNATALFTRVPIGTATAVDRNGRRLRVSLINGSLFFAPGEHIVYWQATDADGNTAFKAQTIKVNPLVSLSKGQVVTEGSDVVVEVILNGPAPVYPVLVPYTVSGSAGENDHTLVSGVAEISSGLSTSIRFTALEDGQSEGTEDIVIALDSSVNRGSQRSSRIVVTEANIAPVVSLTVQQKGENRLTTSENDGAVTVTATLTDANLQDQLSGVWDFGRLIDVTSDQSQLSFDPADQGPGLYQVSYTATDNGSPNLSTTTRVFIVVRSVLPTLDSEDTDGDLIPDDQEGFSDSDGDGIPDYMDAINECNVMPTELLGQTQFVAEGEPGVCLRLGTVAAETDAGGLQIDQESVETDDVAVNIGGIFDFIAYGLPEQGKSYSLVIPQRLPVPANAVYRKFNDVTGWVDFVSNERNSVSSTAGNRGFCPPPGGTEWTDGLTEGHWCVQVTVEDGGPNDADGIANSAIVDPGGVAVILNGNNLPVAAADVASTVVDMPVIVNVLANDSDVDGDALTVSQAVASFGTVTVLADQQLSYTPSVDFIGTDTVIYSITDGKGGTASSELVVTVVSNSAPVATNDIVSTNDKTPLLIAVLANDSDEEGDTLSVTAASATQGTVSIETDQRLRYTPKVGFGGVDTISYSISDGKGGTASATVTVTVTAYQNVVVDNKSSGGAMSVWMVMLLAGAVARRRRAVFGMAAVLLLSFSPLSQSADWYLQGSIGQSTADQQQSRLADDLPDGSIIDMDDSDSSYSVTLGYQVHPYIGLELGYLYLGEASSQISGESLTPEQYHEAVKAVSPVLVDGMTAAVRFTLWQNEQWSVAVPLGVMLWDSEIESSMNGQTLTTKSDGTDLYLGVQLNYELAEAWKVGLGYQQLNLKPNDVNSFMLNVSYNF